jgi:hypothetical protein
MLYRYSSYMPSWHGQGIGLFFFLLFTLHIYPNIRRPCTYDISLPPSSILANCLYRTSVKHVRDFKGPA